MSTSITQFNHLRIPLEEILKATNNFSEKNIIGKGDFGYVYKGQLLHSGELINVSARRLDRSQGQGGVEFWTEISVLSTLEHPNIVSLIGFCDEKGEKIIINRHEAKGSLCMYLDDPNLTWEQRVRISIGAARAISYIHDEEGRNCSIIHRNINSSTILLDENFEAKLSGFEFSIKDSVDRMERYISSEVILTQGYMDPETIKSGDVTQKSDIYSFGVVLCEIMCGRKAFLPDESEDKKFLAPLVRFHDENETLQDIIHPDIWNQVTSGSIKLFAMSACKCISKDRLQRLDINMHLHWLQRLHKNVPLLYYVETLGKLPQSAQDIYNVKKDGSNALLLPSKGELGVMIESTSSGEWKAKHIDSVLKRLRRASLNYPAHDITKLRSDTEAIVESTSSKVWKVKKDGSNALLLPSKGELGVVIESTSSEEWKAKLKIDSVPFHLKGASCNYFAHDITKLKTETEAIVESTSSKMWKVNKFEHLRIRLTDIQLATDNFSKRESVRWSDGSYYVYKGDIECFDREYVSSLEDKNKGELPKRRYNNVRIMRINNANAKAMFHREIEVLSSCKHNNIVSLLGFCDEGRHMILVYEGYNTYGSLRDNLTNYRWYMLVKFCYFTAHGINYIHNEMVDQKVVIHRQISSKSILIDDKHWIKISGFGGSTFLSSNQYEGNAHFREIFLDPLSHCYMAPEFRETGKATKESDIYSFGLVMFEILCGIPFPSYVRSDAESQSEHWFKYGTIKQNVAQRIKEDNLGNKLFLKKGPNEDSLDTFIKITEQCLAVNPEQRPTVQVIIKQLRKVLKFQENRKDHLRMSFKDIESATHNFSRANDIGGGGFGRVYKGKLASEHGSYTIVAKRLDTRSSQGDQQFYNELHILSEYKHENVIGLVGYNNDEQERIIVYEYASKGSLDNYLNDASLTWINRLNICIDVSRGLAFLHGGVREHEAVIHRDMKTANILLFDDWKAKVADFGLSLICTINDETNYVIDHACGTRGYLDPVSEKSRTFTKESDIYSLGVILFEILYGKSTNDIKQRENQFLHSLVQQRLEEGRLDEVVFNAIKNQIVPQALTAFQAIAYQCLHVDREKRPTAQDVIVQLQKALELQVKDVPVSKES